MSCISKESTKTIKMMSLFDETFFFCKSDAGSAMVLRYHQLVTVLNLAVMGLGLMPVLFSMYQL